MGLKPQRPRELSNLERAAVDLVFWEYRKPKTERDGTFDKLKIAIVPDLGPGKRGSHGHNLIEISIRKHRCADDLNYFSALGNTDILKPGNIDYLNTFIHECAHQWEVFHDKYRWRGVFKDEPYDFTQKELTESPPSKHKAKRDDNPWYQKSKKLDILDLLKEQHASAAATWFVIGWQLKYTPSHVNRINLTTDLPGHSVGTVDRYHEIKKRAQFENGRWVMRWKAIELAADFEEVLLKELRNR